MLSEYANDPADGLRGIGEQVWEWVNEGYDYIFVYPMEWPWGSTEIWDGVRKSAVELVDPANAEILNRDERQRSKTVLNGKTQLIIGEAIFEQRSYNPTPYHYCLTSNVQCLLRERLSPPPALALKAAATRLGDSLKRAIPLREHLLQLYRTRCPACGHETAADYYIWSREPADPRQKSVACPARGQSGLAAVDDEDLAVLDQVETRGLHYWYLLNRVPPAGTDEARPQVEKWMELYTPRALYAIADVLMRIEATFDEETQARLKTALLHALGPASNRLRPDSRQLLTQWVTKRREIDKE